MSTSNTKSILSLNRASHRNKTYGKAPHKPILLLAIIELIDQDSINRNRIYITPELVATFQKLWLKLVPHEGWQPRFFLPFFHLSGDKFWHLEMADGARVALTSSYSPKSLAALKDSIHYAYLDDRLWEELIRPEARAEIKHLLLSTYFPNQTYAQHLLHNEAKQYVQQVEMNFLSGAATESSAKYFRMVEYETRSAVFKNEVPKIYSYTCAISKQKVIATSEVQLIDACHIKPWSQTKDDSIQNGITLTPTLHRAFDRHLISLDENYQVIVSPAFTEDARSPYNLRQFEGKKINLPQKTEWYPSQRALEWHRSKLLR